MIPPPETVTTRQNRVCCDGADGIRSTGRYAPSALGHPRVWLEIDEKGYVDCSYCDKRFVLEGGPAARGLTEMGVGDLPQPGDSPAG